MPMPTTSVGNPAVAAVDTAVIAPASSGLVMAELPGTHVGWPSVTSSRYFGLWSVIAIRYCVAFAMATRVGVLPPGVWLAMASAIAVALPAPTGTSMPVVTEHPRAVLGKNFKPQRIVSFAVTACTIAGVI